MCIVHVETPKRNTEEKIYSDRDKFRPRVGFRLVKLKYYTQRHTERAHLVRLWRCLLYKHDEISVAFITIMRTRNKTEKRRRGGKRNSRTASSKSKYDVCVMEMNIYQLCHC